MKTHFKAFLLIVLFVGMTIPAWGQASTQGKEFWVSSTLVCSPDKATPTPYIAISAEKACTVTITGGVGNAINITQQLAAGSWSEFGNGTASQTNPTTGPIKVPMDASKWYPTSMNNANNVSTLAGQKNMYGLHITATENISVYVILSSLHSMDASNILPLTALGSEYYTQDYWSKVKSDFDDAVGLTTILGTEDNTTVEIIPNGDTFDGHLSGQLYTVTLNQGQTYYMVTKKGDKLAGSHIQAKNGKKIAVYCGVPITNVPTGIAARDCLFEQSMPVDYWGTQFIVTRSLEKNGNLIGITATQRGTEIKVDGYTQAYINEGETYYIMLQSANDPNANKAGDSPIDLVVTQDVAYIETSCPCAVYNYDTGNSYKGKNADEIVNGQGDPSSVWVSPIQQKIGKITFGTCYTSKTNDHFLNVVTESATCQNTKLTALKGASQVDKTSLLTWTPVPGNPTYSYARAKIGTSATKEYSVFRLENAKGFIATVYGNGEDESYAYSAGSAAVEQGVNVNGETFTNGYISDSRFCMGSEMEFNANVGTDEITRVDWNFGDGITNNYSTAQVNHTYTVPGWYDVRADLYGHQVCTTEDNKFLGSVKFSFRVVRPDTIRHQKYECVAEDYQGEMGRLDTMYYDCDSVVITGVEYGRESSSSYDLVARDGYELNGSWYTAPYQEVTWVAGKNAQRCDSLVTCRLRIITCLDMNIPNNAEQQHVCPGDRFDLPYNYFKGDIGETHFIFGNKDVIVTPSQGYISLPTNDMKPGIYQAKITVQDTICDQTLEFPIDFTVFYPSDIFKYKFNNVLAVYNKANNGGYDFVAYQWYRNGEPIPGATESVYHTEEPFTLGDTYFVMLTRADGLVLPSCPQTIEIVPNYELDQNQAPQARKQMINQRLYIYIEDRVYDSHGQRIK